MKLPVYNLVVREQKYDDARGDADDARLHTNSDGEGADTIRHKHNDDDDGNFYDNDDDDDKEKDADIDDNDAENGNGGHVNDDNDNNKLIKNSPNSNIHVVHESIVMNMVSATTNNENIEIS